jgi:DNA-binding PadR family transcriptional regulator
MTFWEFMGVALSSAGLFASILGAFLTYAARKNGEATRELIRSDSEATRELIRSMEERMAKLLERMDQRADERQREVIEAIRALKAA